MVAHQTPGDHFSCPTVEAMTMTRKCRFSCGISVIQDQDRELFQLRRQADRLFMTLCQRKLLKTRERVDF